MPVTFAPLMLVRAAPLPLTLVNTPFVAPMLPTFALPLAFNVPVILAPVAVTTNTLAVPPTLVLTLPPELGMLTLLLPFVIL